MFSSISSFGVSAPGRIFDLKVMRRHCHRKSLREKPQIDSFTTQYNDSAHVRPAQTSWLSFAPSPWPPPVIITSDHLLALISSSRCNPALLSPLVSPRRMSPLPHPHPLPPLSRSSLWVMGPPEKLVRILPIPFLPDYFLGFLQRQRGLPPTKQYIGTRRSPSETSQPNQVKLGDYCS